jgi:hypothetical protein
MVRILGLREGIERISAVIEVVVSSVSESDTTDEILPQLFTWY